MIRNNTISEKMLMFASGFIGEQEIVGSEHNSKIISWFKEIGHSWVTTDETAWCSCFVNYIAKISNAEYSGKLNARSWLSIGEEIKHPLPGDIVVFWRESPKSWKGHVGVFVGYNNSPQSTFDNHPETSDLAMADTS